DLPQGPGAARCEAGHFPSIDSRLHACHTADRRGALHGGDFGHFGKRWPAPIPGAPAFLPRVVVPVGKRPSPCSNAIASLHDSFYTTSRTHLCQHPTALSG